MDGDASRVFLPAQSRESAALAAGTDAHALLARGLTELSGALLTIARALQQLAPHPATDQGPSVSRGPEAARGESTEAPKRGAEPRPASKPKGQPKPGKWTPARRALIETMRADRKPAPEILAAVNAEPGEPVTMQQMHAYAYSIGIRTNGPAPRSSTHWTDARDAALREGWERGDDPAEILDAVNAIAGAPPIASEEAIKSRADKLKVRRSAEGWRRARDRGNEKMRGVGRLWTPEMEALLRQHYPNKMLALADLAVTLTAMATGEVTPSAIQQKAAELGIGRPKGVPPRHSDKPQKCTAERKALLAELWVRVPPLAQAAIAEALNALPGERIEANHASAYAVAGLKLAKRGHAAAQQPAAAAAGGQDASAPPAPKAATAAPPASPNKIPPAALTNPAREMAVSAGATSSPDTQSSAAAGGAPRPTVQTIIGASGARVTIAAAPQPTGDDEPPPYDPTRKSSVESRVEHARDLLRKGTEPHIVVMHTKLQLREVFRLQGEVRRERSAA